MTREDIFKQINAFYIDWIRNTAPLTEATTFIDLGFDSLDFAELIFSLESDFDITIPDTVFDVPLTVGGLCDFLVTHYSR